MSPVPDDSSEDAVAYRLAQDRKRAEIFGRVMDKEARAEGYALGWAEGRRDSLRELIPLLAEDLGLELSGPRRVEIAVTELPQLETLWAHLRTKRAWP